MTHFSFLDELSLEMLLFIFIYLFIYNCIENETIQGKCYFPYITSLLCKLICFVNMIKVLWLTALITGLF